MNAEPQLEELSAYLDHELTGSARQDLESHLAGCETCRRRLEALKETVHAVRALPLETPARTFTIPAQRRQAVRWEPAAWVGGLAAAAALVVIVGINFPHGGTSPATAASTLRSQQSGVGAAAPSDRAFSAQLPGANDKAGRTVVTVSDPRDPARQLSLATDSTSYRPDGTMAVYVSVRGWPFATAPQATSQAGIHVYLMRDSSGAELTPYPAETGFSGTNVSFYGSYPLKGLALAQPLPGSYRLVAIWTIPDGRGTTVQVEIPVQITG